MKSLIEELQDNFQIVQLATIEEYTTITSDVCPSHDKAIVDLIDKLKTLGYNQIKLPYLPIPFVLDKRDGSFEARINIIKD